MTEIFKGKFSDDGNTIIGRWEWPEGGYEIAITRDQRHE